MPVRLDRISTRAGDDGTTALSDGSRLGKDHPLIAAIGAIDRANCVLGMVRLQPLPAAIAGALPELQNELFDLGADLATPLGGAHEAHIARTSAAQVLRLDQLLADANAGLPALTSFVLPGGSAAAAWLHLARVDAREAERAVVAAIAAAGAAAGGRRINPEIVRYLNRLSDLLFVWSRASTLAAGLAEPLWQPRATRPHQAP
jgi:cob(I)alamin adenosyltransferase